MADGGCARCGTVPPPGARYCTGCGSPVEGAAPRPRPAAVVVAVPGVEAQRLVECEVCGAGNAASRPLCARCGSPMRDEVPGGDALPRGTPAAEAPARESAREGPSILLALVVLAGLVTAGVLLALVTSRVTTPEATVPTGVGLQAASASSALDGHPASLVIDGDPLTAWTESAEGPGEGEWVEVELLEAVAVRRVLIWNGDQRDPDQFTDNGRAAAVRIEVADRQFRVTLLDITGPQAVDLPEAVTASRVRVVVEEAIPGSRYTDLALSEVVVEG